MAQLKELSTAGVMQTDEPVACTEAVTINGWSGYRGVTLNTLNPNVAEAGSATYGAWTAALKGGTKLVVMLTGYPSDANSIAIDARNGLVYSTTSRTVYLRYLAHAPNLFNPQKFAFPTGGEISGHVRFNQVAAPTAPTAAAATGGSMAAGGYKYAITFVTASGETELGTQTGSVTVGASGSVNLTGIPVSDNTNVIGRRVYRNKLAAQGDFFLVATISDNVTTTYSDTKSDAQIGTSRYTYTGNSTAGSLYIGETLLSRASITETSFGVGSLPVGTGFGNSAFGDGALGFNTSGYYCTAMGEYALRGNSVGIANTAIGAWCLMGGNVTGLNNTAVGFGALQSITSGSTNCGLGSGAGQAITTGQGNLFLGYNTGMHPSSSPDNRAITDDYCGYIGYQAGRSVLGSIKLTNSWAIGKLAKVGQDNTLVVGAVGGSDAMDMVLSGRYFYFGDPGTDGSWRIANAVAGNLVFEKRVAGVWEQKGIFNG